MAYQKLTKEIQRIHVKSKARYGAPKIHQTLVNNGCYLSLKRVQRLMKKAGIRSITKKKYRPYPSKEKVIQLDNLLKRDFSTSSFNRKSLQEDLICGCFYCLEIFNPKELEEWEGKKEDTAICPRCGIDSVIGKSSGFPIKKIF